MSRKLGFESMEARRLLAADLSCLHKDVAVGVSSEAAETFAGNSFSVQSEVSANASADLGDLNGSAIIRSSLGWYNMYDTIGFSVSREADLSIKLSEFGQNVDLYLTDAFGSIVDYSLNSGTATESIEATLDPGQYYLWSIARSYWPTGYRMDVTAELVPEALPEPESTAAPAPPQGGVQPLAEVAYYGGSREWGLNAIGAPEAWAAGYTGAGVTVAVVDTGVDLDHPDLVTNLFVNPGEIPGNGIDDDANGYIDDVHGFDFADNDGDPNDVHGHGTHVAGTIAADDNGFGATGVAPDATILPIKVLGNDGSGSSLNVAAGIRYAADMGAQIINLSLGGGYSSAIESAIVYARSLGSFVIAASGNEYAAMPGFPARFSASYDNVLSVGAYDSAGSVAAFSNDVGGSGAVQIDAPGVSVFSTYVGGQYATMSGTSMATPHVAGLAALTLSANASLTGSELRDLLVSGVVGQASQSDAVGKASTWYSVAYAVAGVAGDTTGAGGGSTSGGSGSGSVGASSFGGAALLTQPTQNHVALRDEVFESDWLADLQAENSDPLVESARGSASNALHDAVDEVVVAWNQDGQLLDDSVGDRVERELTLIA